MAYAQLAGDTCSAEIYDRYVYALWDSRDPASACELCARLHHYAFVQKHCLNCVCVSVCPSASTLTVAFLDRFSPKLAQT